MTVWTSKRLAMVAQRAWHLLVWIPHGELHGQNSRNGPSQETAQLSRSTLFLLKANNPGTEVGTTVTENGSPGHKYCIVFNLSQAQWFTSGLTPSTEYKAGTVVMPVIQKGHPYYVISSEPVWV